MSRRSDRSLLFTLAAVLVRRAAFRLCGRTAPLLLTVSGCSGDMGSKPRPVIAEVPVAGASGGRHDERLADARHATEFVRRTLEEFAALSVTEQEGWCRRQTGYADEPLERCELRAIGNGAAAIVTIVTSCGGDSCDVAGWLLHANLGAPFRIPGAGGAIEAIGDGTVLLVDQNVGEPTQQRIVTMRIDARTGKSEPFAACFSPVLSPRGRYVLCRNERADVLRVDVAGGEPRTLIRSGYEPDEVSWVPYAYVYPDPVRFDDGSLHFDVVLRDGTVIERSVEWRE